ncbi:MAG: FKBP-type peptidyl-prolyl cis-trans isomerase [Porticoccaceae bacterium]
MGICGGHHRRARCDRIWIESAAFGQHNPENVQAVERGNFSDDELEIGAMYSFQNGDGELPGVIVELGDKEIMVDFNHPLAGQNILFKVNIISVSPQQVH